MDYTQLGTLGEVMLINVVLSGDNAIVIAMAAAGLPKAVQGRAIMLGVIAATVMRVGFSVVAVRMLTIVGLTLAGGLLLLWVCWKMWREIQPAEVAFEDAAVEGLATEVQEKSITEALSQIVIADVSMSLDNVLAVAGAARDHFPILVIGLGLSIALMMVASSLIARLLTHYHWLAYVGLAIIAYVAGEMIWEGSFQVVDAINHTS